MNNKVIPFQIKSTKKGTRILDNNNDPNLPLYATTMDFKGVSGFQSNLKTPAKDIHKFLNSASSRFNTVISFLYTFLAKNSQANSLSEKTKWN